MKLFFLNSLLFFSLNLSAQSVSFIKSWSLPPTQKIKKLKIGGLSGCVQEGAYIYFISDDRGGEGGARMIRFPWNAETENLEVNAGESILIANPDSKKILDLEGIGFSKNQFLLSNEGDLNKKPRQKPELFWVNRKGQRTSEIVLDPEFLPNLTGEQTQGIQNNLGFEGLNVDNGLQIWGAFLEGPVIKSAGTAADHLMLIEGGIDQNRIHKKWKYPLPQYEQSATTMALGVTDFLYVTDQQLLVLERGVELSLQGLSYNVQLCSAKKSANGFLERQCKYQFNHDKSLLAAIKKTTNFEGLCWVNEKKTHFLVVSDNNFSKNENTLFLLYKLN